MDGELRVNAPMQSVELWIGDCGLDHRADRAGCWLLGVLPDGGRARGRAILGKRRVPPRVRG